MLRNGIRASTGVQMWRCRLQGRNERRIQQLERWHRHDGGYIRARRRELAAARTRVLARLSELEELLVA